MHNLQKHAKPTEADKQAMDAATASEQAKFDAKYICSAEVCELMGVSRVALIHAYQQHRVPMPIRLFGKGNAGCLWVRETIMPHLNTWHMKLYGMELSYESKS